MVTQEIASVRREEKEPARPQVARRRRQGGFTLIEMLAVVVILAIVAGVGFVVVNQQIEKARVNTDMANLRTIADAANRYIMDGNDPQKLSGTNGQVDQNSVLIGAYLGAPPKDPWNSAYYSIDVQGNTITITSPHGGNNAQKLSVQF
ncbi:type II secretion system protein [Kyrpidia spormannii]|uniref:Type IV pilin n=1 Tax=Kyrpidia spormannii TaxID=2055160 RepID=A0ACA8ZD85_9BACL|nr:type II secretion system protein [Kyrpidia spormannii]CAB3395433.1 Type IV pilin [Kyrpidia spormannii]